MELLNNLSQGLAAGTQLDALLWIALGTLIGVLVGAAPGIGTTVGMAVMLPVAVQLSPENSIFLLISISVGVAFGNSIPAVLIGVPGNAAALLTVIEGHPLHRRGESHRALLVVLTSSVVGQFFGVLLFIAFVIPLANVAIKLLLPELFAIVVFGIVTAAGLVTRNPLKGVAAIAIGLLLALPGQDSITGQVRFTFGWGYLQAGLPVLPVIIGLLAFREVFIAAEKGPAAFRRVEKAKVAFKLLLSKRDWKEISVPMLVGIPVGLAIGVVPGAGATVGSFVSYQAIKMVQHRRRDWGKGSISGLAAVDSAANAATTGELIPTLALGIPGAPAMVILMAALATQGLYAGPQLAQERPDLLYTVFGGLLVGVVILAVVGYLAIPASIYVSSISPPVTMALTLVLIIAGTFALRWQILDVWVCLAFGLIGYLMNRYDYPVAPAALAFILGDLLEGSLRRGLIMTDGWGGFLARPITASLLALAVVAFVGGVTMNRRLAAGIGNGSDRSQP